MSISLDRLQQLIAAFPQQSILGIGDVMLDQYRRGRATHLSTEAPVPDLHNPGLTETPGGAANVAWNIGHLGGQIRMIGIIGKDREAETLHRLLSTTPGVTFLPVEDPSRPTTLKLRFYHDQFQVLRVSQESREPISDPVARACRDLLLQYVENTSVLFIEDYGKGIVTPALVETLGELHRAHPALHILVDPKIGNHTLYRAGMCTLLKPNWKEACALAGLPEDTSDRITVGKTLAEHFDCNVMVTLGSSGALIVDRTSEMAEIIPTRPREAFDIAGAGDTTLAAIALTLAAGGSLREAAVIANIAAGIVVEKSGTASVTSEELLHDLTRDETQTILSALS